MVATTCASLNNKGLHNTAWTSPLTGRCLSCCLISFLGFRTVAVERESWGTGLVAPAAWVRPHQTHMASPAAVADSWGAATWRQHSVQQPRCLWILWAVTVVDFRTIRREACEQLSGQKNVTRGIWKSIKALIQGFPFSGAYKQLGGSEMGVAAEQNTNKQWKKNTFQQNRKQIIISAC